MHGCFGLKLRQLNTARGWQGSVWLCVCVCVCFVFRLPMWVDTQAYLTNVLFLCNSPGGVWSTGESFLAHHAFSSVCWPWPISFLCIEKKKLQRKHLLPRTVCGEKKFRQIVTMHRNTTPGVTFLTHAVQPSARNHFHCFARICPELYFIWLVSIFKTDILSARTQHRSTVIFRSVLTLQAWIFLPRCLLALGFRNLCTSFHTAQRKKKKTISRKGGTTTPKNTHIALAVKTTVRMPFGV